MLEIPPAGQLSMLTAFAGADLNEVLPGVAVPTLLAVWRGDERAPAPSRRRCTPGFPAPNSWCWPGSATTSPLVAPEAFNAEVRRFLSAVP
jgi:hypothetical protein